MIKQLLFLLAISIRVPAQPTQLFLEVEPNVRLEVLDWGGSGLPVLLVPGGGLDAHEFDQFAPKLAQTHHVYALTRRGSGASSAPTPNGSNYSSDRLGDDVLAVADALHLVRPVLIGHSLGGVELSSAGSRHPGKFSGLIYLDAAYSYAFYSKPLGDPVLDVLDLHRRLDQVLSTGLGDPQQLEQLRQSAQQLDRSLHSLETQRALMPPQPARPANVPPTPAIPMAIALERTPYTHLALPVLAIFAVPHDPGALYRNNPAARAAFLANDLLTTSAQADALQAGVPSARVLRIPNASHLIFKSNQAQVLEEIENFTHSLLKP